MTLWRGRGVCPRAKEAKSQAQSPHRPVHLTLLCGLGLSSDPKVMLGVFSQLQCPQPHKETLVPPGPAQRGTEGLPGSSLAQCAVRPSAGLAVTLWGEWLVCRP